MVFNKKLFAAAMVSAMILSSNSCFADDPALESEASEEFLEEDNGDVVDAKGDLETDDLDAILAAEAAFDEPNVDPDSLAEAVEAEEPVYDKMVGKVEQIEPGLWLVDGEECRKKTRMKTYLFMGIDSSEIERPNQIGGGQNDTLILLVIDQNSDSYALIPINRNTYTMVACLDNDNNFQKMLEMQISLAHAQGDGGEASCENGVRAVSDLMYGMPVDGYAAVTMEGIEKLNSLMGGVTVTIEDDFSRCDPELKMGETIKLTDAQARTFITGRMTVADGSNENRMKRQNAYLEGMKVCLETKMNSDKMFAEKLYDNMLPYMTTNMSGNDVSKMAKAIIKNTDLGIRSIDGTKSVDEYGFDAFHADEDSILKLVREFWFDGKE